MLAWSGAEVNAISRLVSENDQFLAGPRSCSANEKLFFVLMATMDDV